MTSAVKLEPCACSGCDYKHCICGKKCRCACLYIPPRERELRAQLEAALSRPTPTDVAEVVRELDELIQRDHVFTNEMWTARIRRAIALLSSGPANKGFTRCNFIDDPPPPFTSWGDWMRQSSLYSDVTICAAKPNACSMNFSTSSKYE